MPTAPWQWLWAIACVTWLSFGVQDWYACSALLSPHMPSQEAFGRQGQARLGYVAVSAVKHQEFWVAKSSPWCSMALFAGHTDTWHTAVY